MSTIPDANAGRTEPPSNTLVLVPSVGHDEDDLCDELLAAPGETSHELLVTCLRSPADRLAARGTDRTSRTTVIDVETDSRSSAATAGEPPATAAVERVPDATDLSALGQRIDRHLTTTGGRTLVCVRSLTALLGATGTAQVFKFLAVLTRSVDAADALAHYHMDPDVHSPETVATLEVLFNAVVDLRDDRP